MPSSLPPREIEIARRLREFREGKMISRAAMAGKIGIGTERLASYEAARAPLRYGVFEQLWMHFSLSPQWLATGEETGHAAVPYDFAIGRGDKRALFSEVFDGKIAENLKSADYQSAQRCWALGSAIEKLRKSLKSGKVASAEAQWFLAEIADVLADCRVKAKESRTIKSARRADKHRGRKGTKK